MRVSISARGRWPFLSCDIQTSSWKKICFDLQLTVNMPVTFIPFCMQTLNVQNRENEQVTGEAI